MMDPTLTSTFRIVISGLENARSEEFRACKASQVSMEMDPLILRQGGQSQTIPVRHFNQVSRIRVDVPVASGRAHAMDSWWKDVTDSGKALSKRIIDIIQTDSEGNDIGGWRLKNAWPCKIGLSPLTRETAATPLTEFYEFVFEGIEQVETKLQRRSSIVAKDVSDIDQRRDDNVRLIADQRRLDSDRAKVMVSNLALKAMHEKEHPLQFRSRREFVEFRNDLRQTLSQAGLNDARIRIKGTGTSFYSENPTKPLGHHFDRAAPKEISDLDIGIESSTLSESLRMRGFKPNPKISPPIFGNSAVKTSVPGLKKFTNKWESRLGRPVSVVGAADPSRPNVSPTDFTFGVKK